MYQVGQGVFGKIRFKDGDMPIYSRPYLIIYVSDEQLGVLNVSSTLGKEHKIIYPTNYSLQNYNPPFIKPSFVKLDSLSYISLDEAANFKLLEDGKCLNQDDLQKIITLLKL